MNAAASTKAAAISRTSTVQSPAGDARTRENAAVANEDEKERLRGGAGNDDCSNGDGTSVGAGGAVAANAAEAQGFGLETKGPLRP
eukprot:CAMPEP_0171975736 /NCGR_PEP_ID=MMETSP0993-20121228/238679_1 /TAXON_ID=483369 /ORGANISM="non described non described, Strain CCMP2098" /LENGTH=85 /DNA_ID=CAMNT_0012627073 /DNA_START=195 /DNA_END=449 /DNA_ORIENTATION=-